ncbi:nickel/cobalt transporter [Bartonella sp. HY329]|uniref:nickel/cobalt transporter n=1 Tax=unclassified Bartonella TaxID=2645622 RepID=UPI0021C8F3E3|nr:MULTISPECIES: nickel/cobalt transporter [unclassified Bartonella]UXM93859.1 nickel/cobalt transporter [Bartonella sp. HY329]UXN08180.1 nickel/cobalt transporter [Bartonella sp. HY328]
MRQIKFMPLIAILFFYSMLTNAFARSPLGIGAPEQQIDSSSIFSQFYMHILRWQQVFEHTIGGYLTGIKENPQNAIWLIGLSFVYGILHAAGPGHGKAVISSYLVANDASLKRGIILSFFSSILQAVSAIFLVLLIFLLLPARLTEATNFLITGSFILITLLGIFMIWRKIKPYFHKKNIKTTVFESTSSLAFNQPTSLSSSLSGKSTLNNKPRLNYEKGGIDHVFDGTGEICNDCGQAHMINPDIVKEPLQWRPALMAVLSVGLRPCNGAIFVMSFVSLNHLWFIGIVSVLAMSLGTFITVSLLASLAVYAKALALKISNRQSHFKFFKSALEWCAAIFIFVTGLSLTLTSIIS